MTVDLLWLLPLLLLVCLVTVLVLVGVAHRWILRWWLLISLLLFTQEHSSCLCMSYLADIRADLQGWWPLRWDTIAILQPRLCRILRLTGLPQLLVARRLLELLVVREQPILRHRRLHRWVRKRLLLVLVLALQTRVAARDRIVLVLDIRLVVSRYQFLLLSCSSERLRLALSGIYFNRIWQDNKMS